MGPASNFAFLGVHDKRLVALGGLAERYFRDDPSTAIFKLRQFAELTAQIIAARQGAYRDERETFDETLRRLSYERIAYTGINIEDLRKLPIAFPERDEQQEIARRIETAFVWIDRLAAQATSARRLIDRLDQAMLGKALRGELVPQDPDDEPVSVLLERIRAERGAAIKIKRGQKAKS